MTETEAYLQELSTRVARLEQPNLSLSKAVAEGVLEALKEAGIDALLQYRGTGDAGELHDPRKPQTDPQDDAQAIRMEKDVESLTPISQEGEGVVMTGLARLPENALLDETALTKIMGVCKRTTRRMIRRHELPPPVRFAGRSTWRVGRVLAWVDGRSERVEREAKRMEARLRRLEP